MVTGSALAAGKEKLRGHLSKEYHSSTPTAVEIFQCLYVDDGTFIFSLHESVICGLNLIYHHFNRFGLNMHIGRDTSPSKTKCVFFPPHASLTLTSPLTFQIATMAATATTLSHMATTHSPMLTYAMNKKQGRNKNMRKPFMTA